MLKDLNVILSHTTANGDCLEWTRCLNTDGYPRAVFDNNFNGKVHRVVYELTSGENITGKVVRHSCDNPKCLNPKHLLIGTPTDNMLDRDKRDRHGAAKLNHEAVHLIRKLHEDNTYNATTLARMFKVSYSTMNSLLNRRHWKHV